jgi:alkylation response protein AidB-like acyl-CoA dehydrogenase
MEFTFSDEQKLIKDTAREFLENECPSDLIREMEDDEKGYCLKLWQKMAELGWLGLIFPAEYGGLDGNFIDMVVLLEEMGRFLAPVPFIPTVICGGLSILSSGDEALKSEILPKVAKGELILTMAISEPEHDIGAGGINLPASEQGSQFFLSGTKIFVPYAHVADYLICPTRTKRTYEKSDGVTLFLVDRAAPGLCCTEMKTLDCSKQYEVVFNQCQVAGAKVIGEVDKGWEITRSVLEGATVAQCALMVGGAEKVLEMTISYAKKRFQFDRPIGSFQAIQHRCSNMLVDLDGAKLNIYEAAWKLSQGLDCTFEVSIAKAWVNQAYQRICANGHQIHGGAGVIQDHDMQLYSRRAKAAEYYWGDTNLHREIVAQQLELDNPARAGRI